MYTVKNNQNLDFTGSVKTDPYGLIQHPSSQKGGKRRKSRKSRKSRRKTRKNKKR
jgi:hypothetical protein